jgi:transposase-like protein
MPAGRPTTYNPEYADRAIEMGKQGASIVEIACDIGVSRQTLYNWRDANPEFLDAITRAAEESQSWWERKGRDSLTTAGFQSSVWSRSMAARFPQDWREKTETEHSFKGDLPTLIDAARAKVAELGNGD